MRLVPTASPAALARQAEGVFTSIQGNDVFAHVQGEGECILFIHGFPTSSLDWRGVVGLLRKDFRCIAPDLVGFGLSDKPLAWSYSLFQQADMIEGLLAAPGCRKAHVVSHDMGTSVHTELLARKAEGRLSFNLASSTFLNGSIIKGMATLTRFQRVLEDPATLDEAAEMVASLPQSYAERLRALMGRADALSDAHAALMTELLVHECGHLRIPHVYSYVRERYLHKDRWIGAIQRERDPVQILWGDADPVANIGMGRKLHELVPQARYAEAPGVGHFLPIEAPELVAKKIAEFVA